MSYIIDLQQHGISLRYKKKKGTMMELISGDDLKIKLKKRKIAQQDIVRDLGYNQTTVSRYYNGHTPMSLSFLMRLSDHYKIPIDELVFIDEWVLNEPHSSYIKVTDNSYIIRRIEDLKKEIAVLESLIKESKKTERQ
jgi:transcriptional regulator with XRE-family HTH domain